MPPVNFNISCHVATQCAISAEGCSYQHEAIRSTLSRYGALRRDLAGDIKIDCGNNL